MLVLCGLCVMARTTDYDIGKKFLRKNIDETLDCVD